MRLFHDHDLHESRLNLILPIIRHLSFARTRLVHRHCPPGSFCSSTKSPTAIIPTVRSIHHCALPSATLLPQSHYCQPGIKPHTIIVAVPSQDVKDDSSYRVMARLEAQQSVSLDQESCTVLTHPEGQPSAHAESSMAQDWHPDLPKTRGKRQSGCSRLVREQS